MSPAPAGAIAIGDYTEAAAVVVLFGLAEWLETRAAGRARDAIAAVLALNPETAILAATGKHQHPPDHNVAVPIRLHLDCTRVRSSLCVARPGRSCVVAQRHSLHIVDLLHGFRAWLCTAAPAASGTCS